MSSKPNPGVEAVREKLQQEICSTRQQIKMRTNTITKIVEAQTKDKRALKVLCDLLRGLNT